MMSLEPAATVGNVQWDPLLLARYDVRGPRYTSYPGAQTFNDQYDLHDYHDQLRATGKLAEPLALYVHIPFCEDICYYCACNKIVTRDRSQGQTYLRYLAKEARLLSSELSTDREVNSLHLGGGSPNFLDMGELTELMFYLGNQFNLSKKPEREFSIEIDPRRISTDTLGLLYGLGFNRLSIGVQDFSPVVQKAINRFQSVEKVAALTEAARDYGFESINYDLMYGLPEQTASRFETTLDRVTELAPDRIALYNYAHLPQRFPSQRAIDRLQLPRADEKLQTLCASSALLQANGYHYIGMDHFVNENDAMYRAARNGKLQRNFQGYSVNHAPHTVALGVSSISSLPDSYSQNIKSLDDYYAALDRLELPLAGGRRLSRDDHVRRAVINSLICQLVVDFKTIESRYHIDFKEYFGEELGRLHALAVDGLVEIGARSLRVTERGRLLLRNICMPFDAYLKQSQATFSKTV